VSDDAYGRAAARPDEPARLVASLTRPRVLALAGGAALTLSYLSVLHHVVDVVGGGVDTGAFLLVVVGSLVLAAVCARAFGSAWAVLFALLLLSGGLAVYLLAVPPAAINLQKQLSDSLSLHSGKSGLRVTAADVWALAATPGPVFLSWYFIGRRAYGPGVFVGGATLAVFLLTGDLGPVPALVGVLGGVAALGFGQLDREGAEPAIRSTLVVVLVAMLVVTTSASLVPGGEARPLRPGSGPTTVEASLTGADARVDVVGSITLSPKTRYTVTAGQARYWRVGAYDRYTGDGWVRTGPSEPYSGDLPYPEGRNVRPLRQTFRAESSVETMPAAWKPRRVDDAPAPVEVTDLGGLAPRGGLQPGERYTVTSLVRNRPSPAELRQTGTDYPSAIEERYLGLPESTPPRLARFTTNLTAGADSPYEEAARIQRWLQENKAYSLSVNRPNGDVASAFVFDMDAGYCTYYATAMVAMLRTQGVPARFVVGYLPGQQVGNDRWLVRGLDSHAWVEVYFPGTGWVQFDPTPAGPRRAAEQQRLDQARQFGEQNVDTNASRPTADPTPTVSGTTPGATGSATPTTTVAPNGTGAARTPDRSLFGAPGATGGGGGGGLPDAETLLYWSVLLLGAVTVLDWLGVLRRLYRALWLRRLPRGPPAERVEAAVERAEYLLGRRYRPRRDGETRRAYLDALGSLGFGSGGFDDRVVALFRLGERARYAGRATERDAAEARRLLGELRGKSGRLG